MTKTHAQGNNLGPTPRQISIPHIRMSLIALSLVAMSPLFILTVLTGVEGRRQAMKESRREVMTLARIVSDEFRLLVEGPRQLLAILSSVPVVQGGTPEQQQEFFATIVRDNPQYANVGLISTEGRMLACAFASGEPEDFSERAYFRKALEERRFVIGEFHIGPLSHEPSIGFARPIFGTDGSLQAVIFAALDLSWLSRLALAADLPAGSALTLWDGSGTVLLRHPDHELWIGRPGNDSDVFRSLSAQRGEGTAESKGLDGIARLYAYRRLVGSQIEAAVTLSIGIPVDVANAPARNLERRNLITLGVAAILAALLSAVFGERVVLRVFSSLLTIANTDDLTRTASRRRLLADAERECARCHRFDHPVSVLMIDIDRFKRVNDSFGHATGDVVLASVALRMASLLRDLDLIGRYGGEEFVVVLPESSVDEAAEVAERLRSAVAATPVETGAGQVEVTVSIGVATRTSNLYRLPDLLAAADSALFRAKESGRNRVVIAGKA